MFSKSLLLTTLVASIGSAFAANSDNLAADTPAETNLVQCTNTTLTWSGGNAPFNVYVFTDCTDTNQDPIATFTNVSTWQVNWWISLQSGAGFFFQVEDAVDSAYSNDAYVGGDATQAGACAAIASSSAAASASLASVASVSATATTSAVTTSGDAPSTIAGLAKATTSASVGGNGVANAVKGASSSSGAAAATGGITPNGASSITIRPLEIGAGLFAAVGLAALL